MEQSLANAAAKILVRRKCQDTPNQVQCIKSTKPKALSEFLNFHLAMFPWIQWWWAAWVWWQVQQWTLISSQLWCNKTPWCNSRWCSNRLCNNSSNNMLWANQCKTLTVSNLLLLPWEVTINNQLAVTNKPLSQVTLNSIQAMHNWWAVSNHSNTTMAAMLAKTLMHLIMLTWVKDLKFYELHNHSLNILYIRTFI